MERRRHLRISATGPIGARFPDDGLTLRVLDVSLGGFRAEAENPLSIGRNYVVELQTPQQTVMVTSRVAYCRLKVRGRPMFDIGFEFAKPCRADTAKAVECLLLDVLATVEKPMARPA